MCEKLKNIYFNDIHWSDCYKNVAVKFTELKEKARKFYVEKQEIEILKELCKYNEQDLIDMMSHTKDCV